MPLLTVLMLALLPALLFVLGGTWMMRATGRAHFRQRRAQPASAPLNLRARGYSAADAGEYWSWLGADGRAAEMRFLKADMVFPLWYGGLMLGSILVAQHWRPTPLPSAALVAPIVVAILADWLENLVHLRQLARFPGPGVPAVGAVRVASIATQTKLVAFWAGTAVMLGLAAWVAVGGARG